MLSIFSKNSKIKFSDLYQREGLIALQDMFDKFFGDFDGYLQFKDLLDNPDKYEKKQQSEILIEAAKVLEEFLAVIFGIEKENSKLQLDHNELALIYQIKRNFIQKDISRKMSLQDVDDFDGLDFIFHYYIKDKNGSQYHSRQDDYFYDKLEIVDLELQLAKMFKENPQDKSLRKYCAWALLSDEGQKLHKDGSLFKLPKKINFENLIDAQSEEKNGLNIKKTNNKNIKNRDSFKLTDNGFDLNQAISEAKYCIFCHKQGKDSCKTGLIQPNILSSVTNNLNGIKDSKLQKHGLHHSCAIKNIDFKTDQFDSSLEGCPLEEKISEMNLLKSEGFSIAALAMAVIDNPMIAATGHRICNDCMKSCIYQKQDPVDIPQVETRTLKDVLNLPYGFEIYSLLTRWNPLNLERPIEKQKTGNKVLVAGLGPAGFTLAHHLLNEGHLVVAIDGLKIEPLNKDISGIDLSGKRHDFKPIKDIQEIYEDLDKRPMYGFGGVAEYGITVRWDKNFLKIIRLLLERRASFQMFGGVRLGSAFDCEDALRELDFDHVALCLGAGWPNIINIKNNFAKGIRSASDFLMALQLTGAQNKDLLTNLQVRLPILVVGGGLTAMDTACESLAYYVVQVEKFAYRYQILCDQFGEEKTQKDWNEEEKIIANEFLDHAQQISKTREAGGNISLLLKELGGAKIIYRKKLIDSPSYRLNHQEVKKAFEEGIEFVERVTPDEAILDDFGHIEFLKVKTPNSEVKMPVKSLFVAIGTSPNKAPIFEGKMKFKMENNTFQTIDLKEDRLKPVYSTKAKNIGFLAAKDPQNNKFVSFFGDGHPSFAGNVVKAMASAKRGYPVISQSLKLLKNDYYDGDYKKFLNKVNSEFIVKVQQVDILTDNAFELVVYAPILAKKTHIGHIFRLNNYHNLALKKKDSLLAMEGVALTAFKVDQEQGLIHTLVINTGGSTSLVKNLKKDEPIIFMGPSGSAARIVENQVVMLVATGRGNLPLAALAKEHKKKGCKVILFSGYRKNQDVVKLKELEESCDQLILSIEDQPEIKTRARLFHGNVIDAILAYEKEELKAVDVIYAMSNEDVMHKLSELRHSQLKKYLKPDHIGITSLNNPMQCMLKGVCSQCLQVKTDSKTGKKNYFYACISQDQKMDEIDFNFLKKRCSQNSLQEKLTKDWIRFLEF